MSKSIFQATMAMVAAMVVSTGGAQAADAVAFGRPVLHAAISVQPDAERQLLIAEADIGNPSYPKVDVEGVARLLVDGQPIGGGQLGAGDRLRLLGELPADGQPHEVCVHFAGTASSVVRGKVQAKAIVLDECVIAPASELQEPTMTHLIER